MKIINSYLRPSVNLLTETDPRKKIGFLTQRLPMKTIMLRNKKLRLYSLGWLAKLAGKSTRTIHRWEIEGIWPKPLLKLNDGVRWYTAAEVNAYSSLIQASGIRSGKVKKGKELPSLWIKRNAFALQYEIKKYMDEKFDTFPTQLHGEGEMLQLLAKSHHFRPTHKQLMALIEGNKL